MKNRFIWLFCMMVFFVPIALLTSYWNSIQYTWASETLQKVDVETNTSPTNILLNVTNMKPGDITEQVLVVYNKDNLDFKYDIKASYSGSEKLYNQLLLSIFDDHNSSLYSGKLSDFTNLPARFLLSFHSEPLTFKLTLPACSGNDFQGLAAEAIFVITAESAEIPSDLWDKSSLCFTGQGQNLKKVYAVVENQNEAKTMQGQVSYEVFWAKSGNPKNGLIVAEGNIYALKPGEKQTLTYDTKGVAGKYMFKAYQRPGHPGKGELWSNEIQIPK